MVDSRGLKAGATVMVSGQVIQALVAFAANLVLVRHIAPAEFGRFAVVYAGASLVLSIVSLRVGTLIIRTPATAFTVTVQERYFNVLAIETVLALVLGLAWVAYAWPTGSWSMLLVAVICGQHWIGHNKAFYERNMRYVKLGVVETSGIIAAHLVSVVLVLKGSGAAALYLRELMALVVTFCGLWAVGGVTLRRFRRLGVEEWRGVFREVRGVWLDSALESAYQRVLILAAGVLGGDRGAGFFFQAQRLALLPNQITAPVVARMVPTWFGQEDRAVVRTRVRNRLLRILAGPLALGAVAAVLFADPVVPWIFGSAWHPTAGLLAMLWGLILFSSLFEVLKGYCIVTFRTRILPLARAAQYLGLALPFAVLFLFPDRPGLTWLAIGVSVGFAVAFFAVLAQLRRTEGRPRGPRGGTGGVPPDTFGGGRPRGPRA
ncbi:MAG: oligosaccharide flippase family protein [Rhodospirillales bacterium]